MSSKHWPLPERPVNPWDQDTQITPPHAFAPAKSQTSSGEVSLKRERSPSPALTAPAPTPITEGSIRIFPLPDDCRSGAPNCAQSRKQLIHKEIAKLKAKKIIPTRAFTREDGIVIDWKSSRPVMSDTLLPVQAPLSSELPKGEHTAISSATDTKMRIVKAGTYAPQHQNIRTENVISSSGERIVIPRSTDVFRISDPSKMLKKVQDGTNTPQHRNRRIVKSTSTFSSSSIVHSVIDVDAIEDDENSAATSPSLSNVHASSSTLSPRPLLSARTALNSNPRQSNDRRRSRGRVMDSASADVNEVMSVIPLHVAESEPIPISKLATSTATNDFPPLSLQEGTMLQKAAIDYLHRFLSLFLSDRAALASAYSRNVIFSVQSTSDAIRRGIRQGRPKASEGLLALPDECGVNTHEEISYDLTCLPVGVLLVCYSSSTHPDTKTLCQQQFLLRKKDQDEEDRCTEGLWPVVAVIHQITVQQIPILLKS